MSLWQNRKMEMAGLYFMFRADPQIGTGHLFRCCKIADFILSISSNPAVILLVINIVLLVLGMFMEPGAILTLMLPVLLPIAKALNLDLVHFGVMMVLNLMIGQVTPPFGVCLFVISDVGKVKLDKLYKAILPFLIPLIIVLFMCTYIPGLVTWLPNLLLG